MILGIASLIQPITNTTGWLFITQGRTKDMFRLAMFGGPFTVLTIIAGLPWGAIGVAISYVTGQLLLTNIGYWYVGRRGPVHTIDLYRTIAPFLFAAGFALLSCVLFRLQVHPSKPLVGMLWCSVIALLATLVVLIAVPGGRKALLDAKRAVHLMSQKA